MKRPLAAIFWKATIGLGLAASAIADDAVLRKGGQADSGRTGAPSPLRSGKTAVTPRDSGLARVSADGLAALPPETVQVPGSAPARPLEPAPPPPAAMEPLPSDPESSKPDPGALVSIHYDNTDIRSALEVFSRREKMNLLVSPNVTGLITVNLDGVTRRQALEAILSLGNLEARLINGLTYIYTADEFKALSLARRRLTTKVYRLNYARANEIAKMIQSFLSTDGKITSTPESDEGIDENANFSAGLPTVSTSASGGGGGGSGKGMGTTGGNQIASEDVIIVQDYPDNLAIVDDMVARLDVMPVQVLIEAVIIRVNLNRSQQLGINFGAVDHLGTVLGVVGDSQQFGQTVGFAPLKLLTAGAVAGVSSVTGNASTATAFNQPGYGVKFGYIGGNVSTFVQALETLGKTNVLATPRLLVLNKQRAEIQLGNRLGYRTLVTNLTSTVQQVQFLNTGTLLRLRPFISDDGMIRMEIHPERSTGLIDANGVPQTNTARMTTNVIVPNGATLVIGGLIDNQDDVTQSGVPGLNRLPLVGAAFRNRNQDVLKSEVVVLLTPRIWNPVDPEGLNCAPTTKTSLDTATRVTQKIELGADRTAKDGLLGGRLYVWDTPGRADRLQANDPGKNPYTHTVRSGENFWTISRLYYKSGRYYMALWDANKKLVPAPDRLVVGDKIIVPRADQLNPELIQEMPGAGMPLPTPEPVIMAPPPPADGTPGPFGQNKTKDPATRVASQTRVAPQPKTTPTGR